MRGVRQNFAFTQKNAKAREASFVRRRRKLYAWIFTKVVDEQNCSGIILALADSRTLKALVEFRDGSSRKPVGATSGICRFCGTTGNTGLLAIGNICADHECQEHAKNACSKAHPCGHICGGVRNERTCLPCLHRCVAGSDLKQDADDMCMICFTEALSAAPAIQLQCGHVFHLHCCKHILMKRWVGPRITFGFSLLSNL